MNADLELVAIDVPQGTAMESQSGLQMARPRIYGALVGPSTSRTGMIVMHPASNFMGHYLLDAFAAEACRSSHSILATSTTTPR